MHFKQNRPTIKNQNAGELSSTVLYKMDETVKRKFCEGVSEVTINEIINDLFEEFGDERLNKRKKPQLH